MLLQITYRSTAAILAGYRSLELMFSNFRGRMVISFSLLFFVMILVSFSFIAIFCVLVIGLY